MELKVTGGYSDLIQGLQGLPIKVDRLGQEWTRESAQLAKTKYISNLDRSSSQSSIHSLKGEHGRLRDQLSIEFAREGDTWIAVLGFPDNWATAAAITQDQGATIEVTEKMRDFFLAIGRPLREGKIVIDIPGSRDWTDAMRESTEEAQWLLKEISFILRNHAKTPIVRHEKVKGEASQ